MIRNYQQLALYRQQLARAEDALVSLHERVYARNPKNYAIFGESYIDMILQLRAEIDAFLHIAPPKEDDHGPSDNGAVTDEQAAAEPAEQTIGS